MEVLQAKFQKKEKRKTKKIPSRIDGLFTDEVNIKIRGAITILCLTRTVSAHGSREIAFCFVNQTAPRLMGRH